MTTLITELTTPITAVTAPVTAITAPITADKAPARQADVGTPERGRLQVLHRRSRASEVATRQAWRPSLQPRRRQLQGGFLDHPIQGLASCKTLTLMKQQYLAGCKRGIERGEGSIEELETREYQVPIHNPNASNVSRKRQGAQICMYTRAGSA